MAELDQNQIKKNIQASDILSEKEKAEWLYLLPRMTAEQISELDRILSIKLPAKKALGPSLPVPPPPGPVVSSSPAGEAGKPPTPSFFSPLSRGRKSESGSLPSPADAKALAGKHGGETIPTISSPDILGGDREGIASAASQSRPIALRPPLPPRLPPVAPVTSGIPAPSVNNDLEKLQILTIADMRQAPSVYVFLESLGKKFKDLRERRVASAEELARALELSPLYKTYIDAGLKLMDAQNPDSLTHEEFEAITDFRMSLREL